MNASSNIIFNYIGIFVNLYIWEKSKQIFDVSLFNLVMFVFWSISFTVGSRLLSVYSTRLLIRLTAICGGITFLLLTTLTLDNRIVWIAVIAIPVGIMWGLYCATQNITLSVFGKGKDFEGYFALASIIGQAISIANPIVFALVIKWVGYYGSFLLMFVFVAILLAVSFSIPQITLSGEKEPLLRGMRFSAVFSYPAIRWLVPSCLTAGVFIQFQGLFALIFTFSVSSDKLVIALLNVLYASLVIVAMILYRKLGWSNRTWLIIGVVAVSAGFVVALLQHSAFLIVSNVLTTAGLFYFGTVWNTEHFRIISRHSAIEQARILIWREWLLNISRILMLFFILFVQDMSGGAFLSLLVIAIVCALSIPYTTNGLMYAKQKQSGEAAV